MRERDADIRRLDSAIGRIEELLDEPINRDAQPNIVFQSKEIRLQAADRLVRLLERRAKLLGLDAERGELTAGESVLDRMTREIAAAGAAGKS